MESKDGNVEENSSGPCLGMQFKTADDAYRWYNDYARRVGFSVRIDRQERSRRDGEVISRVFVCSREGKRRVKDANKEKKTNTEQVNARVGCQAYLMVKRRRGPVEDCWEVTRFHELHNHDLVPPTKVPFLRSHKRRPPTTENYIENIPNSRIHEDNNSSSPAEGATSSGNCVALEETATGSGVADPVPNAEPSTDEADTLVEYMGQKPNSAESEPPLEVDPCPTLGGDSSPRLGMRFNTADDAYTWYNDFARRVGFSVRINHQEKSRRDGEVISRSFVCSREGQRREKLNREKRRKVEPTRIGCQAYLKVKRRRSPTEDFWVVTKFHKPHNHDLMCPNKAILLRSHRRIRRSMQSSIEDFQNPFVSGDNTASLLVGASGLSNSVFSQRDSYNNLSTKRRVPLGKGDARAMLDYCKEMQKNNPSFFYALQVDEDNRVRNFFWADSRSRMSYRYFGDVVFFDTTYRTDQYKVPLVAFNGVNHHRQPVLFGCALLCDDSEASFVWLFNVWLEAMFGRHPTTIITEQDAGMARAIARVFPRTNHRLCMSLIIKKVPDILQQVYSEHRTFGDDFLACCKLSDTIAQFEERWRQLLNDYGLGENIWLRSLYDIRERWIPAYTRNTFSAGMLTSQQTENPYSFFDGFVNKETTLQEFIKSFDKATDHRYKEECEADFQTLYSNPVLKIYLPMEAQAPETFTSVGNSVLKMQLPMEIQAAESYTKVVFKDFQEELVRSLCYAAEEVEGGWELKTYRVREYWQDTQQHTVTFNVSETRATCTCLMFESEGILCRHALKIFLMCGVLELPSYYLLERWTRNAKSRDVYDQQGVVMQVDWKKSATMRYNDLCRRAIKCAEDGATSVEVYDMAVSAIERCWKEIVEAKKIEARNAQLSALLTGSIQEDNIEEGSQVDHSSIQINLEDPQGLITKGGPSDQTFDGSLEKRKGAKTCSVCKGHDHNKRKCPHLEGQREFLAVQDQLPTGQ